MGFRAGRSHGMLDVVLDTSIFSGDRRRGSGPFRALTRLCKGKKVKIHVPFVVIKEFCTQEEQEMRKWLKRMRKLADELSGRTPLDAICRIVEMSKSKAEELRKNTSNLDWRKSVAWLTVVGGVEHEI